MTHGTMTENVVLNADVFFPGKVIRLWAAH